MDIKPEDCKRDCNGPDCEGCRDYTPKAMDIQKEAEQLRAGIIESYLNDELDAERNSIDLILRSFEKVCREQRKAVMDHYYDSDNEGGTLYTISQTPLLTSNN